MGGNSTILEVIDIGLKSKSEFGRKLSNLVDHPFVFDGVECRCIEGVLQAFKFSDVKE